MARGLGRLIGVAVGMLLLLSVLTGILYPLVMTGAAQALFPGTADGSLVRLDGQVVGSKLVGQEFTSPGYFHSRPSATTPADNPLATTASFSFCCATTIGLALTTSSSPMT